MVLSRASL